MVPIDWDSGSFFLAGLASVNARRTRSPRKEIGNVAIEVVADRLKGFQGDILTPQFDPGERRFGQSNIVAEIFEIPPIPALEQIIAQSPGQIA